MKFAQMAVLGLACMCFLSGCNKDESAFIGLIDDFDAISQQEDCNNAAEEMNAWIKKNGKTFKAEFSNIMHNRGKTPAAVRVEEVSKSILKHCSGNLGYLGASKSFFELMNPEKPSR